MLLVAPLRLADESFIVLLIDFEGVSENIKLYG